MPLLELVILDIHSFPHFSLTYFDISGWNFTYDFVLLYYRSGSSVVNFRQFLMKLYPFRNVEYWKFTVFRTFILHALTYYAEILHMNLFYCTTDSVWVSLICVDFCGSYAPLLEIIILEIHSFLHFSPTCFDIFSWNFTYDLFNVQKIKFECHNSVSVWLSVCPSISCIFLLHTSTYLAEN